MFAMFLRLHTWVFDYLCTEILNAMKMGSFANRERVDEPFKSYRAENGQFLEDGCEVYTEKPIEY
jgi:hypothetical protein